MAPRKNTSAAAAAAAAPADVVAAPVAETPVPVAVAETPVEAVAAETTTEVAVAAVAAKGTAGATERVLAISELALEIQVGQKALAGKTKDLLALIKAVQKDIVQLQKEGGRKSRGARAKAAAAAAALEGGDAAVVAPRAPSGFAKPAVLSVELCEFLGVPEATMMARTDVTRLITKYVKDKTLFDVKDKRTITPDDKLLKLLAVKADETLTYFNLQAHMKHHFLKAEPVAPVAPAPAPAAIAV